MFVSGKHLVLSLTFGNLYTPYYLRNLRIGPISWSATLRLGVEKQSSLLIPFVNYEKKLNVLNTALMGCLHYGENRSKVGPFLNIENIFLWFKRH